MHGQSSQSPCAVWFLVSLVTLVVHPNLPKDMCYVTSFLGKFGWTTRVTRLTRNSVTVCGVDLVLIRSTMLQCMVNLVNLPVLYGFL